MITRKDDEGYMVPAPLVHWAITSIFGAIVAIGGYMVYWAKSDAEWKATILTKFTVLETKVSSIDVKVENGQLPVAKQRLDDLERRMIHAEKLHYK